MRKKQKKKITYVEKINHRLKTYLTDAEINRWWRVYNPMLGMETPQSWIRVRWGKRLWDIIENEEYRICSRITNK